MLGLSEVLGFIAILIRIAEREDAAFGPGNILEQVVGAGAEHPLRTNIVNSGLARDSSDGPRSPDASLDLP
jgi:hypothetical protein